MHQKSEVNDPTFIFISHACNTIDPYKLMSEIQLRQICDRLEAKSSGKEDGQETMNKNDKAISKLCKEAVHIPGIVPESIKSAFIAYLS